jgi:hypothetical protein
LRAGGASTAWPRSSACIVMPFIDTGAIMSATRPRPAISAVLPSWLRLPSARRSRAIPCWTISASAARCSLASLPR